MPSSTSFLKTKRKNESRNRCSAGGQNQPQPCVRVQHPERIYTTPISRLLMQLPVHFFQRHITAGAQC